jgi:pimeloyl-ACP methyl ester carboxylesterase
VVLALLAIACASVPADEQPDALSTTPLAIPDQRRALVDAGLAPRWVDTAFGRVRVFAGGSGPVLVLVHGTGSQAGDWYGVVPELRRDHRLLVIDLPGHGESGPAEGPLPVGELARALGDVLAAEAPAGGATVVGNSLGGWVALLLAAREPARIARVVGISSSGIVGQVAVPLQPKTREEARRLAAAIRGPHVALPGDEELDAMVARVGSGPAARVFAGLRLDDFLESRAASLEVPVDLLWGEEDGVLTLDYGRRLASLLPRARLRTLPGCGHMPQLYCPAETARELREILALPPPADATTTSPP